MSNGLDPDQDQHSVPPDLGPKRLLGNSSCFSRRLVTFFKINSFKKILLGTLSVSNGLDSDQDRQNVGPNCLQRLTAADKSFR